MTDQEFALVQDLVKTVAERVMKELGPDHIEESVYDAAMCLEFAGLSSEHQSFVSQPTLPIAYDGTMIAALYPDFYLSFTDDETGHIERVIVELKRLSPEKLGEGARAQVRAYLKHSRIERALLVNFQYDGKVAIEAFRR